MGKGRKTRRALERGGAGPGKRLNEALALWTGVLFACFPVREKEHDLWIRLSADDQARALGDSRIRPHRRFSKKGWIELDVDGVEDMDPALRWLRRAYTAAAPGAPGGDAPHR